MIYVLYGQPGSGKSSLAKLLKLDLIKEIIRSGAFSPKIPVIIDGDEFRCLFNNIDYSKNGRESNIKAANIIASYMSKSESKDVIMALVNPYKHLRDELISNNTEVVQILLQTNRTLKKDYHVEQFEVGEPDHILNTDRPIEDTYNELKQKLWCDHLSS